MTVKVHFFKNPGKIGEVDISNRQGYHPRLGEGVHHGEDRFIVVDVSWDFNKDTVDVSALFQEPEEC